MFYKRNKQSFDGYWENDESVTRCTFVSGRYKTVEKGDYRVSSR